MEEVLNTVNGQFIRLPYAAIRRNNKIIKAVLDQLVEMLREDQLFDGLYRKKYYGGSYYVGLKVGRPDEYDIDILFTLPKCAKAKIILSDEPGFSFVHMETMHIFHKQRQETAKYPNLGRTLLDNKDYLSSTKTSAWMESIVVTALKDNDNQFRTCFGTVYVTFRKAGPAFTLTLQESAATQGTEIDIDLVPCFAFDQKNWPKRPFRQNPFKFKPEFFMVPKRPYHDANERLWRFSFQQQENYLIKNKKTLKAALRLLKKLRDTERHPISSYHIKTVFMWQVDKNRHFFDNSLKYVFLEMLILYKEFIKNGGIPYFWDKRNNLLKERLSKDTLQKIANRLENIINDIQRNPENAIDYLLKKGEHKRFCSNHGNLLENCRQELKQHK